MFSPRARGIILLWALLFVGASRVSAYVFTGYKWPYGTQIVVNLGLNRPAVPLQDGSGSWNASAADALAIWNQHLLTVQFAAAEASNAAPNDGINSASFSNTIFGESWGNNTLAVAITYTPRPIYTETDVIFNNTREWNSYRGPIQGSGSNATWDLHRVALHEFGHVLGLDHPDAAGQSVSAIMNSIISNLDQLSVDDIAGARALYPGSITSSSFPPDGRVGDAYSYQITANFPVSSYGGQGLPPGLSVNPESGLISGVPTSGGTFDGVISASRGLASVSANVRIVIYPRQITSSPFIDVTSGNELRYQITADNSPTSFTTSALPSGLSFDAATGVISGRLITSGTFFVDVTAHGSLGVAAARLRISVIPLPLTSSTEPPAIAIGGSISYQILAGNNPTSYSAQGLPAGLTIDPATGLISGTPTVTGSFAVTVRAISATSEAGATVFFRITPPRITNNGLPQGEIGVSFSHQVTATHPAIFSASGLPPGLQIEPSTGVISGTPTVSGPFHVQITARTSYGEAFGTYFVQILGPRFTSSLTHVVGTGAPIRIQPRVSHPASSFSATALPAGVAIDSQSGVITGAVSINGRYLINLRAETSVGPATGLLTLIVSADAFTDPTAAIYNFVPSSMALDPPRHRLYVGSGDSIRVIDTNTLAEIGTVPLTAPARDLSLSRDGNKLWIASGGSYYLALINLESLTVERVMTPSVPVATVREGLDNRLYVHSGFGSMLQMDASTGAVQETFWSTSTVPAYLEISPDGRTAFVGNWMKIVRFDISGATPVFRQEVTVSNNAQHITLSRNGGIVFLASRFQDPPVLLSANDLTHKQGTLLTNGSAKAGFAPDDSRIYFGSGDVQVFETATSKRLWRIRVGDSITALGPLVEGSDRYVFVPTMSELRVYSTAEPPPPPPPPPPPARNLINVSTRVRALTGDAVPIGGFIIEGAAPKRVIVRAIGPSLPLSGRLQDPNLTLHASDGRVLASNENWWWPNQGDVLASKLPPGHTLEAAIVLTLDPGAYTAILRGVNGTTGVSLIEVFDVSPESGSRIRNLSTRGRVETGDNVMIGGFIIGGDQPTRVMVRALGPSLAQSGVQDSLENPTLDLYDANGVVFASNDDWTIGQGQEIATSGLAPRDGREAALIRTLPPGAYTAIVRGKNGTSGVALVELYNLEP